MSSRLLIFVLAGFAAPLVASCDGGGDGASEPATTVAEQDRTATLGGLLVLEDDVDFLSGNGEAPLSEEFPDEYYEEPPAQLCDDGETVEMVANRDVFNLLDNEALIFLGQWISGEPTDAASSRFSAGRKVIDSCFDDAQSARSDGEPWYERWDIENPGLDDLEGMVLIEDERPLVHVAYARHGGVVTFLYFQTTSAVWRPWTEEERDTIIEIAFGKLLERGRLTLPPPPARTPGTATPSVSTALTPTTDSLTMPTVIVPFSTEPSLTASTPRSLPSTSMSLPSTTIDVSLAERIPQLRGYDVRDAANVDWVAYGLPGGADAYAAEVSSGGEVVGQLVVAGRPERNQLFDTYTRRLFNEPITLDDDATALARWEPISDAAVITAKLVDQDAGQWAWLHDGVFYVARGRLVTEQFVAALIEAQGVGRDPSNYESLSGDLPDRLRDASNVAVYDLPPSDALAVMLTTRGWPCAERFYVAHLPADDNPDPRTVDDRSLIIDITEIGNSCERIGFVERLTIELDSDPNLRSDSIVGHDVFRNEQEILLLSGSALLRFSAGDPTTLITDEPLIEQIIHDWTE